MSPIQRVLVLFGTLSLFACDQSAPPPKPAATPPAASSTRPAQGPSGSELPARQPSLPATHAQPTPKVDVLPATEPQVEPAPSSLTVPTAPPASGAKEPVPVELKPESKPRVITLPVKEVQAKGKSTPKLDLSLNPNVFDPLQPVEKTEIATEGLLPPLFGEKPADESPFQINGKLITNDQQRGDYWDSVEGAQLNFEFKQ